VQIFCEKDNKSTMLPQANQAFIGSNVWSERAPRNSCQ